MNMYDCPICKQPRGSKLHTDKCSRKAQQVLEPTTTEERTPEAHLPLRRPKRSRALNKFY